MKTMRSFILSGILASICASSIGCSYGAVTSHQGKLYVVRNDTALFGVLRKIFECTPTGAGKMNCVEVDGAP